MFNYIHADINVNYTRTAKYGYIFSQLIYIYSLFKSELHAPPSFATLWALAFV